jgi:hypothetical protein
MVAHKPKTREECFWCIQEALYSPIGQLLVYNNTHKIGGNPLTGNSKSGGVELGMSTRKER